MGRTARAPRHRDVCPWHSHRSDLEVTYAPWKWMLLGAEFDVLWPGEFYKDHTPMTKAVLAVDFLTP